jgi:hypothetical protein
MLGEVRPAASTVIVKVLPLEESVSSCVPAILLLILVVISKVNTPSRFWSEFIALLSNFSAPVQL